MFIPRYLVAAAATAVALAPARVAAQHTDPMASVYVSGNMTASDVRNAIEDELILDPGVDAQDVTVEFVDGVATLTGTVDNVLARDRATRIAETVRGVQSVVNRVTVEPTVSRTGDQLRDDVIDALFTNPATDAYELHVAADDAGAVALTGEVDSWTERRLSERIAKGVAGVTSVRNDITVAATTDRPDGEIRREIEQALYWSALVDSGLVDVAVDDGTVRLTGTVGSAAEKRQAELKAWTRGVTAVDASGLEVADWARDDQQRTSLHVDRPDAEVQASIDRALLLDPRVNSLNVETAVNGGTATLRGTVDNLAASRAAWADARNTVGVSSVRDRLHVSPGEARNEADIAAAIRKALTRDPYVQRKEITVSVVGGRAYLYGTVDNYFEKAVADDVAAGVEGVTDVENDLLVRSENWVGYDPFVGDPYIYGYDWYDYQPRRTWLRDDRIRDDIEDQLFWSPFVDAGDVTVDVEDGVATLTGQVDSWSEYRAARENAYEGGAVWVDNDLTIRPAS